MDNVTATISSTRLDISFSYNGIAYWIEGIEVIDDAWYCAVYSVGDIESDGMSNLQNDVLSVPSDEGFRSTNEQPGAIANISFQNTVTTVQTVQGDGNWIQVQSFRSIPEPKNKSCAPGKDPEYRVCRIVLAADYELYNSYGSLWTTLALTKLNVVAAQYEAQVGITFSVVAYVEVPTSAIPTSMTDALLVLNAFDNYMEVYQSGIVRDVSHLCSGKDFNGETLGAAFEQGVGTARWQNSANYAYSISMLPGEWGSFTMGHELGHNFNGDHVWAGSGWMGNWPNPMTFGTDNANRVRNWATQTLDLSKVYNPGPSSISSDKLQSSGLYLQDQNGGWFYHPPGSPVTVGYNIKNTGTTSITISYLFVGARDAGGVNRDFGYRYNVVISPGSTYAYIWTWTPTSGGTWTLWPAYYVSGHYGPYQWITIQPSMYYLKGSNTCYEKNTLKNVCYFYKDCLLSTVQTPVVGSTVWFYFTLYNGNVGTSTNNYDFFFVLCRWGSNAKDFGITSALTLTQSTIYDIRPPGGGYTVFASRVIDVAGTWNFWPCYKITQGGTIYWGPTIYGISLTV